MAKKQNGKDPVVSAIEELGRGLKQLGKDLGDRIDGTNSRLDQTNVRLERVETRLEGVERAVVDLRTTDEGLGARIDRTNERVDVLAQATSQGFARLETRLDEIVLNTGGHYRELSRRVEALEGGESLKSSQIDTRLKSLEEAWLAFLAKRNGDR